MRLWAGCVYSHFNQAFTLSHVNCVRLWLKCLEFLWLHSKINTEGSKMRSHFWGLEAAAAGLQYVFFKPANRVHRCQSPSNQKKLCFAKNECVAKSWQFWHSANTSLAQISNFCNQKKDISKVDNDRECHLEDIWYHPLFSHQKLC